MAATVRGVSALQNELEKAKESLKDVDENIKKLTGRDPTIQRTPQGQGQRRVSLGSAESRGGRTGVENRLFNLARRGIVQDESPVVKRRLGVGGAFSRLGPRPGGRDRVGPRGRDSGDEDDMPNRPSIQSSVIATPKEERSRQNSIEEQSKDRKGQARNRRMFGLLLGTLQKFKDDAAVTRDKEEQRVKIEKKLEEKFKQEKEEIIQERRQLFLERRQKQFRIKLLEQKMEMAQNHDDWVIETRKLENFIRTKAKPHLFFMPKIRTDDSEAKLRDTKKVIEEIIEDRRKRLEEEISEMMSQVQDQDDGGDDGDASMGEDQRDSNGEGEGDSEGEERRDRLGIKVEKSSPTKPWDDKENKHDRGRERHMSVKDDDLDERVKRDKEREQRDKDRQMKDKRREERKKEREERERKGSIGESKKRDRSKSREGNRGKDRSRDRDHKDRAGERDKEREKRRERDRSGDSHSRERHRSGKVKSEKERRGRDYSDDEKHGHGVKSKRRSKGEGKTKEKIWEPMEDEVEEEFVGSKPNETENVGIASKMLAMAGMTDVMKEAKEREKEIEAMEEQEQLHIGGESIPELGDLPVEDIPRPPGAVSSLGEMGDRDANNLLKTDS